MSFSTTYTRFKSFVNGGSLLPSDLNAIQDDLGNQLAGVNVAGGFNEGANVRRGKFIQPAVGSRTNTAYGALSNGPDQVANIVLPGDGLIIIAFQAVAQSTVLGAGRAAIFLGANQVKSFGTALASQEATIGAGTGAANVDHILAAGAGGLVSPNSGGYAGDATTGQIIGADGVYGYTVLHAAGGTYTISVQYKATSGTISVKNRRLWVRSEAY